ncbi:MAG: ribonuclease [Acidobacteriota bacterium]|jgi:ribonuclease G|nr:ribonuclease [Acidobacteriota bacterium]
MSKEMIVSVNGREKKIAIVENGRVTEFYIERGESSQGIVGNIYKGRVMRVLPGMQSAFVDIGLERDAFLYVSDFFDEEEEFERIVVDKKKTEGADDEAAQRAAVERIERSRVERERAVEKAQEEAEPEGESEEEPFPADAQHAALAEHVTDEEAPAPVATTLAAATPQESEEAGGRKRERGRGRRRRGERTEAESGTPASTSGEVPPGVSFPRGSEGFGADDVSTPFAAAADSFERVVDEEESAAEFGSAFKDARLQERLSDQTRAVEFDMEPTTTAEVGSLLGGASSGGGFERIVDSDAEASDDTHARLHSVQPEVAAAVAEFVEDEAGADAFAGTQAFERVSDDEKAADTSSSRKRGGKGAAATTTASRAASKKGSKKGATTTASQSEAEGVSEEGKAASKKRAAGGSSKSASKKSATKGSKATASKGGSKRGKKSGGESGEGEDSAASVTQRRSRGEFARRGGRRRRKPGGAPGSEQQENGNGHDAATEIAPDDNGAAEVVVEAEAPAPVAQQPQAPAPAPAAAAPHAERRERGGRGREREAGREGSREGARSGSDRNRESRGESSRATSRGGEREASREGSREGGRDVAREGGREGGREASREGSREGGRAPRESGGGGRSRRERQPMITDLLREGQEIIVQIAKEPIAAKGARITSHIALPGRFLVYMPTIEHVGVSRKIESDQERVRLRKLIQAIVKEEDVPSGGFIVRTAGVGISEQDLRDDARYLIRTWRDIRKSAERAKAPAMAHKDLDLVQRLLRDQLSDDFTAIRVDSEEEYLEVVEFINRIQPRLVNRVKLHTREEPILETYGVQAEIDKAIKPRVWLKSGGYLVINQTEALVAIDVNTGKFVGRGGTRLEDTITRTNMEAVDEIARQVRLRDLGGIIVLDLIDMEERRNRARVLQALQDALRHDKSPTKVLSFNDFGLVIMTRKRVKQSLERTLCTPCPYCTGAGLVKSAQTICYEVLEESRRLARANEGENFKQTTLRLNPEVARALRSTERDVLGEIEAYLGPVDITADEHVHQEQFDFAFI